MRGRFACVLAVVAVVAAACSSPPTRQGGDEGGQPTGTGFEEVMSAIEGLSGQARTDKLVELAEQEEGVLNLYTSLTSDVEAGVSDAFEDAYGIDVAVYRADSETVLQRVLQESRANFAGADVVETNGPELNNLSTEGVLAPYDSEYVAALIEGSVYEGWVATRFNKFVISWNTDIVAEGEQPTSWEELADPKWDGELVMEVEDVEWYKTLWEYWVEQEGKSPEEADQLFQDMADGAAIIKGHTVMAELTAAGEYGVAASNYSYIVDTAAAEGAPVAWQPVVEPILSRPNGGGLVTGAPHPATAVLFMDWLLSDGQKVLVDHFLTPARADMQEAASAKEVLVDLASLATEEEEWTTRYQEVVESGSVIE